MTPRMLRTTALALAALAFVPLTADAWRHPHHGAHHWEALGTLTVADHTDHDVLPVTGAQGTFRKLKLEVFDRAVQFRDMKVHFANGQVQDVALRELIPAGGESRVIDVSGAERAIRSIELRYDAQSHGKKARVRIYGQN
jgi:hypothetical protein